MRFPRLFLLFSLLAAAAASADSVNQAAALVEQQTANVPAVLRIDFRMRAAQALAERHPDLARHLVDLSVAEIRSGKDWSLGPAVLDAFAAVAPSEGVSLIPKLGPDATAGMISALARANRTGAAAALYRQSLAAGDLQIFAASSVLSQLAKEKPAEAAGLLREILAAVHFDAVEPYDAYRLLSCANAVASVAPEAAAEAYERVAVAASAPDYGAKAKTGMTARVQIGADSVTTDSRDTLLVVSGSRLRDVAPQRFDKMKAVFARWDLSGPVKLQSLNFRIAAAPPPRADNAAASISKRLGQMRGLPTDADRARLVMELTADIRALPAGASRLNLAQSLANLSTEGDLGNEALTAVATTLGEALHDAAPSSGPYLELASLVRYEHVPAPAADSALDAAGSLLALREQLHQEAGFTLTGLDGKSYSLSALRGHVVLLNFWATWCPPCRKEMPDMEKLYQRFQPQGLIVLAVSDEERETVEAFEKKQKYTFPILLDPDRKVNTTFNVEGIPKSFVFDREGHLAAQSIDMRTERQFLEMLKRAGVETQ